MNNKMYLDVRIVDRDSVALPLSDLVSLRFYPESGLINFIDSSGWVVKRNIEELSEISLKVKANEKVYGART